MQTTTNAAKKIITPKEQRDSGTMYTSGSRKKKPRFVPANAEDRAREDERRAEQGFEDRCGGFTD